ncbi:MAG: Pseudogene of putative outer membrane protein pmp6 precursor [Methanobrevibacter sp. CfCl-M3]
MRYKSLLSLLIISLMLLAGISATVATENLKTHDTNKNDLFIKMDLRSFNWDKTLDLTYRIDHGTHYTTDYMKHEIPYNQEFSLEEQVRNSNLNNFIEVPIIHENINNVIEINHSLTIYGNSETPVKLKTSSNKGIFKVAKGVKLNLINIELDNLNISYDSGIIENKGNLTLNNCIFNNNHVVESKGYIIYNLENSSSTIFNCSFNNNDMSLGSVVAGKLSENVNISRSMFKNNMANGFGATVINNKSNSFVIDESVFDSNTGSFGGAIYNILFSNKKLTIENSIFNNNSAHVKGGAIYNSDGAGFNIYNCSLKDNSAQEEGGGIYNNNCDDFTIKLSVFRDNSAVRGGGVYTTSAVSNIGNSGFYNNHAGSGGAVYNADGKKYSYVYDHSFFENNGNSNINSYGGAVTLNNANYQFTQTYFGNNSASKGAAIYIGENSQVYLKDDIFRFNKFNNDSHFFDSYGGVIYSVDSGRIDMVRTKLSNNSANFGGSIFSLGTLQVYDSSFTNNTASSDGGSVYSSGQLNMTNSSCVNNTASGDGGAIYKGKKINGLKIDTSNFTGNKGSDGGAIYNDFSKDGIINNSNFYSNSATNGGVLYNTGSHFSVSNSHFNNNLGREGNVFWFKAMYIYLIDSYINDNHIEHNTSDMHVFDSEYYNKYIYITYN